MSHSAQAGRAALGRTPLRVRVLAGVVAVTLVALVAFDVGAVSTVRRYLLAQTDGNLHGALTLTVPRLAVFLAASAAAGDQSGAWTYSERPTSRTTPSQQRSPLSGTPLALPGAFDITFLPARGAQVTLQQAVNASPAWHLNSSAAKVAAAPGPHILAGPDGTQIRVMSLDVPGGSLVAGTSLDQTYETIVRVELVVIIGSIAVVVLIGLGVFAVLRRGLRPIEAMAAQAERITAGNLTQRVHPQHPGSEVGRLSAALNGMLARIEAAVDEREASQQQMRRFFADASHELRTPLASLRANAELYQQGALAGPDDVVEVMDRIVLETRRMGRLVDDMLRLARLGQQPGQSREPVDLTAVITGCAERAQIADPARSWQVRIDPGLSTVGDEELLRRAVDNLLMNVLVHTPAGTRGSITAHSSGDRVTIEVSDDGPGVPPAQLPHIFERFYRATPPSHPRAAPASNGTASSSTASSGTASSGTDTTLPGSGLGLAITAEIIAAHGGTAHATPARPHGLRVTLTVPAHGDLAGLRPAPQLAARA